jgi:hypothetical protein
VLAVRAKMVSWAKENAWAEARNPTCLENSQETARLASLVEVRDCRGCKAGMGVGMPLMEGFECQHEMCGLEL